MKQFEILKLNPVDRMVASYGRALKVLSENWPVLDGDDEVSPTRAMAEASICGLGAAAARAIQTALTHFREDLVGSGS